MPKNKTSDIKKKILDAYEENEYANIMQNRNRSRSLTVGTAFGGIVEVSMRGDYHHLWCTLQPVEVVEIIEQLAASAGLQIAIRPRQDFATWRGWNLDAEHKYWAGASYEQVAKVIEAQERHALESKEAKESKETKKLPAQRKKKSVIKQPQKKIAEMNDDVNQKMNEFYEDVRNETEILDEERIRRSKEIGGNIDFSYAVEHIGKIRDEITAEREEKINKEVDEFFEILNNKYEEHE